MRYALQETPKEPPSHVWLPRRIEIHMHLRVRFLKLGNNGPADGCKAPVAARGDDFLQLPGTLNPKDEKTVDPRLNQSLLPRSSLSLETSARQTNAVRICMLSYSMSANCLSSGPLTAV